MQVRKRNNQLVNMDLSKITQRVRKLCSSLTKVDPVRVAIGTVGSLYDGISTEEIDQIAARFANSLKLEEPEYDDLAGKILMSNLHKNTSPSFKATMIKLFEGKKLTPQMEFVVKHGDELDKMIIPQQDYSVTYFSFTTFVNQYAGKIIVPQTTANGVHLYSDGNVTLPKNMLTDLTGFKLLTKQVPFDRPQYMHMRVAVQLFADLDNVSESLSNISKHYKYHSAKYFTHATPTLQNSCTPTPQLDSCFLYSIGDSREEILKCVDDTAAISAKLGGIGISMSDIRPRGDIIKSTGSSASGVVAMMKMLDSTLMAFNQGGKRPGSGAIYIEPHSPDSLKVIQCRMGEVSPEEHCQNVFPALYISDLFMKRFINNEKWSFFSPVSAPGLSSVFDGMKVCKHCNYCNNVDYLDVFDVDPCDNHEFESKSVYTELYTKYEKEGRAFSTMPARNFEAYICKALRLTGTPYLVMKDAVNRQCMQMNVGTIKGSNLCAEIVQWFNTNSYANCTLASINLKMFVQGTEFDFEKLHEVAMFAAYSLNAVLHTTMYPVKECKINSDALFPIAVGVQGLADVFAMLKYPFISEEAQKLDIRIAETIYHAALQQSNLLAKVKGSYEFFENSPAAESILHFDKWSENRKALGVDHSIPFSGRFDWGILKSEIKKYGLRNSLLVAYMPTVSTSQLLDNCESFEPFPGVIWTKDTQSGLFLMTNRYFIEDMKKLNLWNETIRAKIAAASGIIRDIVEIPPHIREIYMDVWTCRQKDLQNRAALRQAFIDQAQSLNIYLTSDKISDAHIRAVLRNGYEQGLKTVSYYTKTRSDKKAMETSTSIVNNSIVNNSKVEQDVGNVCSRDNPDCESCSG